MTFEIQFSLQLPYGIIMHFIIVILFSSASRRHWLWFSTLQIQDDWFDIKASMVTNTTALQIHSLFLELWSLFNTIHDKNVVPVRPWFCELAGGGTATSSGFKKPPPQTTVPEWWMELLSRPWAVNTRRVQFCFPLGSASEVKLRIQM